MNILKKISIFIFLLSLSFSGLKAQTHQYSFTVLCDRVEGNNIINPVSGFSSSYVGRTKTFTTATYFRGLVGGTHSAYWVIEKPDGTVQKTEVFTFSLKHKAYQALRTKTWEDFSFPVKGNYAIKVYIDGKLDSTLYLGLGN